MQLFVVLAMLGLQIARSHAQQKFSVYGLNYNARKGPDWAPESAKCKSPDEIKQDLEIIRGVTDAVRLYSLTDCNQGEVVIPAALRAGLKVSVGLWVSDDPTVFHAEKAKLQELIRPERELFSADRIFGIHVGSEAIYRKEVTPATSIAYMKEVKALCAAHAHTAQIPVTIADIGDVYLQHKELVDAVDIVSANGFPFWEKQEAKTSAAHFAEKMEPLFSYAKSRGKDVFIGETGWASAGKSNKSSEASPANAATYLRDFRAMAAARGWKYFYFAAFDEAWKVEGEKEDTVEAHFGLFKADRSLKEEFRALVDSSNSTTSGGASSTPMPSSSQRPESAVETGAAPASGESPVVAPAPAPVSATPMPSPTPSVSAATGDLQQHLCTSA